MKVDLPQLLSVPAIAIPGSPGLQVGGQQPQRVPGGLDVRLVLSAFGPEHEGVRSELAAAPKDGHQSPLGVKRNATVLLVLRGMAWDTDLMRLPVHPFVLNEQHLASSAAELERADDAVVHHRAVALERAA